MGEVFEEGKMAYINTNEICFSIKTRFDKRELNPARGGLSSLFIIRFSDIFVDGDIPERATQ